VNASQTCNAGSRGARPYHPRAARKCAPERVYRACEREPFAVDVKTLMISSKSDFDRKVLSIVLAFEALLFWSFYCREIAWYPPLNFDQLAYLEEAYRLQERILGHGLGDLLRASWYKGHYNGLVLPIEGALSGLLLGGTRWPQLAVNLVFFGALQVFAFYAARNVWDRRVFGYAVVGLILCQATAWLPRGGLFDFRMDFSAYCVYGIWACAVIRSKLFLDRRWAIGCGLIGGFLVLHRFVTVVYLLGVCAGFAGVCVAVRLLRRADADLSGRMWRRFCNLSLSAGVIIIIGAPILILNWPAIHNYYVVGHLVGNEKYIRAAEVGIRDPVGHLLYYPKSIIWDHLGQTFLFGSAITIAGGVAARCFGRSGNFGDKPASYRDETFLLQVIFLVGAVLGPIIVLTADIAKSEVVGGIVGVPAALLIVTLVAHVTSKLRGPEFSRGSKVLVAASLAVFALGLFSLFNRAGRHLPEYAQRRDLKRLVELDKWLIDYASERGWRDPYISYDVISDRINSGVINVSALEQSREPVVFHTLLGAGMMGVGQSEALSLLKASDFVILTTLQKTGLYPFYRDVARYWGRLKAWADEEMILVKTVPFDGFTATVYARPSPILSGLSAGWLPRDGLLIEAPRAALRRFPEIRLRGPADYSRLPKTPTVSATVDTAAGPQLVPALFKRIDTGYEILIDTSPMELPPSGNIILRLQFDTFFVPKNFGNSDDARELVVQAPTLVQLIRTGS
jgi:hypothetical protein